MKNKKEVQYQSGNSPDEFNDEVFDANFLILEKFSSKMNAWVWILEKNSWLRAEKKSFHGWKTKRFQAGMARFPEKS